MMNLAVYELAAVANLRFTVRTELTKIATNSFASLSSFSN